MRIALIAALARNHAIGFRGKLPWHLPSDLAHFQQTTLGRPVLMGRKTYESIGRPLPGRENIVVSRDPAFDAAGCRVAGSLEKGLALAAPAERVLVIGGASLYEQLLPRADRLYLTFVDAEIEGDAFFPKLDFTRFELVSETLHARDDRHPFAFRIARFDRQGPARRALRSGRRDPAPASPRPRA